MIEGEHSSVTTELAASGLASLTLEQVGSFASIASLAIALVTLCIAIYTANTVTRINQAYQARIFLPKFNTEISKMIRVIAEHVVEKRWDDALSQAEMAAATLDYIFSYGDEIVRTSIEEFRGALSKSERVPSRKAEVLLTSLQKVHRHTKHFVETLAWQETK